MKQHYIQQKGLSDKPFDGTQQSLEHLMVDLEMTANARGWHKYFMVRMKNSAVTYTTKNFFTHKSSAEPKEMISYYSRKHDSRTE